MISTIKSTANEETNYPVLLKFFAHIISVVFHPLFITVYGAYYLIYTHLSFFNGLNGHAKRWIIIRIIINMVIFPGITVLLLKGVGFIDSVLLHKQRDRIIPYITTGIFFFWMYLVFKNQENISLVLVSFIFSVFLSSSAAMILNIYNKVSMHAVGMGGLIGLFWVVTKTTHSSVAVPLPLMVVLLITGLVCTARLIITDHTPKQIYVGLITGILCQLIGGLIILN
ncbi:hypothetical protein BH09BAC2_BH09BAC2_05010 [soil metagenome]